MKVRYLFYLVAFLSPSLFSCEDDNRAPDCEFDLLMCTEEFRSISLEISDVNGNPVILDDFYTFLDSRKRFEYELDADQMANGIYPVFTDADLQEIEKAGTTLIFVGEIEDRNLVEHQMVIGHDCCHIQLVEGKKKIIIEVP